MTKGEAEFIWIGLQINNLGNAGVDQQPGAGRTRLFLAVNRRTLQGHSMKGSLGNQIHLGMNAGAFSPGPAARYTV
jgi:hypothetical protein